MKFQTTTDCHVILHFLELVALRLRLRAVYRGGLYLLAFLAALSFSAPFLAHWWKLDIRSAWGMAVIVAASVLGCFVLAYYLPSRRWSKTKAKAQYVGSIEDSLCSDLLSSIEFIDELEGDANVNVNANANGSIQLRKALVADTALRIGSLASKKLVPLSTVRRPLAAVSLVLLVYAASARLAPATRAAGWKQLFREPEAPPFEGASLSPSPLMGDVDIEVIFPRYTQKPNLHLPASSGDFEAMAGSTVTIRTRAKGPVQSASILLAQTDEMSTDDEIPLTKTFSESKTLSGSPSETPLLGASLYLMKETFYRFEIRTNSSHQVEARARHITILRDRAPVITLYAPADELDVAKLRRIELAYVASDDYSVQKIDLVFTPKGGKEYRTTLYPSSPIHPSLGSLPPATSPLAKNAQSKYLWDLSLLPLHPGVQIEYHLEAFDNDTVQGPNIGRSRSYSLRLFSPRDRHSDLVGRQKELAEHMLQLLAARLEGMGAALYAHREVGALAEALVVEMGGLAAALKEDELSTKALRSTISGLRDRMGKRLARETSLFESLKKSAQTNIAGALLASDNQIIPELEEDVLKLSDWIARQGLENLLAISDEVAASRERIKKLFAEYERTGSKEVLDEIEREFKSLQRKLQEMEHKGASIPEDVLDKFVNRDALVQKREKSCLARVSELLENGDIKAAQEQMERCDKELDEQAQALEDSLRALRGENFSQEEKRFNEMMNDLSDLRSDQENIASKAEEIYTRYSETVEKLQGDASNETRDAAKETLELLARSLQDLPTSDLTKFAQEDIAILSKRLDDTSEMLDQGQYAEALAMAQYAEQSLQAIGDELQYSLDNEWSRQNVTADKIVRDALPLAEKLVEQLKAATPSSEEIMSSDDRKALDRLRRRQKTMQRRTKTIAKKAKAQADSMPGAAGNAVGKGLQEALKHMKAAQEQMRNHAPAGARQQSREAARKLKDAQNSAQGAARQRQQLGQRGWRDEPVRIPGAQEYRAPEKFREEILNAMEDDDAPSGFGEQVKRYYKDIIQ